MRRRQPARPGRIEEVPIKRALVIAMVSCFALTSILTGPARVNRPPSLRLSRRPRPRPKRAACTPELLSGPGIPEHRSGHHVRPDQRRGHPPQESRRVVRSRGLGRRLEDGERRHDLDADLRRTGLLLRSAAWPSIPEPRRPSGSGPARTSAAATWASATGSTRA